MKHLRWYGSYWNAFSLQTWFDTDLKWNKTLYDDIDLIELDPFDIWTPQIKISNRFINYSYK